MKSQKLAQRASIVLFLIFSATLSTYGKFSIPLSKSVVDNLNDLSQQKAEKDNIVLGDVPYTYLQNLKNIQYTGPLYFGSNQAKAQVLFDTGFDQVTVTRTNCETCTSQIYDPTDSDSAGQEDAQGFSTRDGVFQFYGFDYEDTVCLQKNDDCAYGYEFFGIVNASQNFNYDGILGLSPTLSGEGVTFLQALYDSEVIFKQEFSLLLGTLGQMCVATFGGYNSDFLYQNSSYQAPLNYFELESNSSWKINLHQIKYQGVNGSYHVYSLGLKKDSTVQFLSSTPFINLPQGELKRLEHYWKETAGYGGLEIQCEEMCYFEGSCQEHESLFGYVEFELDDKTTFWLNSNQYMMHGESIGMEGYCLFGFREHEEESVTLGDVFLRQFYTVYDYQHQRMGVAFNIYNQPLKNEIVLPVIPDVPDTPVVPDEEPSDEEEEPIDEETDDSSSSSSEEEEVVPPHDKEDDIDDTIDDNIDDDTIDESEDETGEDTSEDSMSGGKIFLIVLAILLFLITVVGIWCCCKKRVKEETPESMFGDKPIHPQSQMLGEPEEDETRDTLASWSSEEPAQKKKKKRRPKKKTIVKDEEELLE